MPIEEALRWRTLPLAARGRGPALGLGWDAVWATRWGSSPTATDCYPPHAPGKKENHYQGLGLGPLLRLHRASVILLARHPKTNVIAILALLAKMSKHLSIAVFGLVSPTGTMRSQPIRNQYVAEKVRRKILDRQHFPVPLRPTRTVTGPSSSSTSRMLSKSESFDPLDHKCLRELLIPFNRAK